MGRSLRSHDFYGSKIDCFLTKNFSKNYLQLVPLVEEFLGVQDTYLPTCQVSG